LASKASATSSIAVPRNRKRELRRLRDLATVQWRILPVTWDEITDTPDDVVASIIGTLAA
jgi:hypothetical protein